MSVIVCVDYGQKRLGVACSDDERLMAFPYESLNSSDIDKLILIINKMKSNLVVIGWPNCSKDHAAYFEYESNALVETPFQKQILLFSRRLKERYNGKIVFFDESYSSLAAVNKIYDNRQYLMKGMNSSSVKFKHLKDKVSAYEILKSFLDYLELNHIKC